jgi:cytochrome c peroxidase
MVRSSAISLFTWLLILGVTFRPAFLSISEASAQPPQPQPNTPSSIRGEAALFERVKPRPELSTEARASQLKDLRKRYEAKPEQWPAPLIDKGVQWKELGLLPTIEHPKSNPHSVAKEELGRRLFFDPRISGSGQLACASCHDPDLGWADGRAMAFGDARKELKRNSLSILNAAHQQKFFWDGRADSLEAQLTDVLTNPGEMHSSEAHLAETLSKIPEYAAEFEAVFGEKTITLDRVAQAVACFEHTVVGGRSRFDNFMRGNKRALSDQAIAGLHLFRTDARCLNCHHGPNFSDGQFHNLGLSYYGRKIVDSGRYEVTKKQEDLGKFRTPSLRNVLETRPYMHNGQFDLEQILILYNNGIPTLMPQSAAKDDPWAPKEKSPHIKPLGLNDVDLEDLKAFLQSLSEPRARIRPPKLPGVESLIDDH